MLNKRQTFVKTKRGKDPQLIILLDNVLMLLDQKHSKKHILPLFFQKLPLV